MDARVEIECFLREDGQLASGSATLTPLAGGVSCEIFKVEQAGRVFVVKRALPKLRVAAEWLADVSRNAIEYDFFEAMKESLSDSLPGIFFHNRARGYFIMEYLGEGWITWKELLLQGQAEPALGALAGSLMGRLHAGSWGDDALASRFDTTANFRQLRTDPYLRAAAERLPEVGEELRTEADRIESCRMCLVHGDFSPKNLLVQNGRIILLDAEVAWFGEPAFDVAFLQVHFFLKGLHLASRSFAWEQTAGSAWDAYCKIMGKPVDPEFEERCTRLLAILLLARVDGKSPVEYLSAASRATVRAFALACLREKTRSFSAMRSAWQKHISSLYEN